MSAAAPRPVPHHRSGDRGRAASPETGAPAPPLDAPVDRNALLARLLIELDRARAEFSAAGFGAFRAEWESRHAHQGKPVTVLLPDGRSERGEARGVADDGSLLLETTNGLKRFHSGEVSLRPEAEGVTRDT